MHRFNGSACGRLLSLMPVCLSTRTSVTRPLGSRLNVTKVSIWRISRPVGAQRSILSRICGPSARFTSRFTSAPALRATAPCLGDVPVVGFGLLPAPLTASSKLLLKGLGVACLGWLAALGLGCVTACLVKGFGVGFGVGLGVGFSTTLGSGFSGVFSTFITGVGSGSAGAGSAADSAGAGSSSTGSGAVETSATSPTSETEIGCGLVMRSAVKKAPSAKAPSNSA